MPMAGIETTLLLLYDNSTHLLAAIGAPVLTNKIIGIRVLDTVPLSSS